MVRHAVASKSVCVCNSLFCREDTAKLLLFGHRSRRATNDVQEVPNIPVRNTLRIGTGINPPIRTTPWPR